MAYWIQIGRRFNIPNQTNTIRLKDKAAPLVTTKEIMPIKSNVTRLFNIICLFSKNSFYLLQLKSCHERHLLTIYAILIKKAVNAWFVGKNIGKKMGSNGAALTIV